MLNIAELSLPIDPFFGMCLVEQIIWHIAHGAHVKRAVVMPTGHLVGHPTGHPAGHPTGDRDCQSVRVGAGWFRLVWGWFEYKCM